MADAPTTTRQPFELAKLRGDRPIRRRRIDPEEARRLEQRFRRALTAPLTGLTIPIRVSSPDIALQFAPCLENIPNADPNLASSVTAAVEAAVGEADEVRYACQAGTGRIGVWLRPPSPLEAPDARQRGLSALALVGAAELGRVAFAIDDSLIRRLAQETFAVMDKRYNVQGDPDPDGRIHLTALTVQFQAPNKILTRIQGLYDAPSPVPNVPFEVVVTDTLSVSGGRIRCTSTTEVDVNAGFLNVLIAVFLALAAIASPLFLIGVAATIGAGIFISGLEGPAVEGGAGAAAAAMIPSEILIPGGQKVTIAYDAVAVSANGIVARGTASVVARVPRVRIAGPTQVDLIVDQGAAARVYSASQIDDLRAPLRFAWASDGLVASPASASTRITFPAPGAQPGDTFDRRVSLAVTDADGLQATDAVTVEIEVIEIPDDIGVGDVPSICLRKPWLPECRGAF